MFILWCVLVHIFTIISAVDEDVDYEDSLYCTRRYANLCRGKGVHVGCQFPKLGPGPMCRNYTKVVFHDKLKNLITNYINRRRQRIAAGQERVRNGMLLPRPEIMMFVEWNHQLATLAQRLADQCSFVHDECRATARFPYAGQSVGEVRWRRSFNVEANMVVTQKAVRRILEAWWVEKRRVTPQQLTRPFRLDLRGAPWGHFSQLAVWSLRAVGCGAVRHGTRNVRLLLVCDFSHTNMLGQRTITPGPPADCPPRTARRSRSPYPLLCVHLPKRSTPCPKYRTETPFEDDYSTEDDTNVDYEYHATAAPVRNGAAESKIPRIHVKARKKTTHHHMPVYDESIYREADVKPAAVVTAVGSVRAPTRPRYDQEYDDDERGNVNANDFEEVSEFVVKKVTRKWRNRSPVEERPGIEDDFQSDRRQMVTSSQFEHDVEPLRIVNEDVQELRPQEPIRPGRKWKQTRDRPRRPGANALLQDKESIDGRTSTQEIERRRTTEETDSGDKEFIDQIFKDTGFRIRPVIQA